MRVHNERLSAYAGKTLLLKQSSLVRRDSDLVFEDTILGNVKFPRLFSFDADVKIFDKTWQIKSQSFWRKELGIYKYGNELPNWVYKGKTISRKGFVKLDRGRQLLINLNIFKRISEVALENGEILITGQVKIGLKSVIALSILKENQLLDENPWVILLIAYLELTRQR